MPRLHLNNFDDEFLDYTDPARRQAPPGKLRTPRVHNPSDHVVMDEIQRHTNPDQARDKFGTDNVFTPTYQGSRYERAWILNYLGRFYEERILLDVLRQVKGGKEATVYCCTAHPDTNLDLLAAKIYRPRALRQLRNNVRYRQGRAILDEQGKAVTKDWNLLKAIRQGTTIGKEAEHNSWIEHEFQALSLLHNAGADVPRPIARGNNTILMEYMGEPDEPAPTLNHVHLTGREAKQFHQRLIHNIELMLKHNRIHGDLSAYNVLYWGGDIRVIDFPQAIDSRTNPEAFAIFARDVERICQYFARYGVRSDAAQLAHDLWQRSGPAPTPVLPEDEEEAAWA